MTKPQTTLYFREWGAVRKADPSADRHALHAQALGADKSSKDFTNRDLDKVLGAFRAISRPADLAAQIDRSDQPRKRLLWRINSTLKLLALYVEDAEGYVKSIMRDKFDSSHGFEPEIKDLKSDPRIRVHPTTGERQERISELEMMAVTLWARLQKFRAAKRHSLHDMFTLAGQPCPCSVCRKPSPHSGQSPNPF